MNKSRLLGAVCAVMFSVITLSANAALVSRLGGLAFYDDVADLTWLADANYSATQYSNSGGTEGDADGTMSWSDANTWAAGLDIAGVTGWRLPTTIDVGNDGPTYEITTFQGVDYGYNITTHSEMSNMFYNVLGNTAWYDINGVATGCTAPNYCITNTGPFSNLQPDVYYSSTLYPPSSTDVWAFFMSRGLQANVGKGGQRFAWAVQSGDISAVPIPSAVWLFSSGLIGLVSLAKRKT